MALGGPEGQATGQEATDPAPQDTPFDLGDSRDLATAVRAAWASAPPSSPLGSPPAPGAMATGAVPRPAPDAGGGSGRDEVGRDPLAHLRGEVQRRRLRPRFTFSPARRSTVLASLGVAVAIAAVAAIPVVSGGHPRPTSRIVDQRSDPTTTTSTTRRAVPTTAFTYAPETLVPPEPAPVPATVSTPAPVAPSPAAKPATTGATTATSSRPRTTTTTRRASSPTTRAPSPTTTTTQPPPPPPPDDGGGSGDPGDPPPYP